MKGKYVTLDKEITKKIIKEKIVPNKINKLVVKCSFKFMFTGKKCDKLSFSVV